MALLRIFAIRENRLEFWRYFCAGSLSFLADVTVLVVLAEGLGAHYLAANAVSVTIGISLNYWFCIRWVFTRRKFSNRFAFEAPAFFFICLVGLAINEGFLWVCVAGFSMHYLLAKVLVTGAVFIINYAMKKVTLFS